MRKIYIFFSAILLFNSCSDNSGIFDPTYYGEGFHGITFTGINDPTPLQQPDPSDWCPSQRYGGNQIISDISLNPAYPNPINYGDRTNISFSLPGRRNVLLYVLSNSGVKLTLMDAMNEAGSHQVSVNSSNLGAPGVYRVVMVSDNFLCYGDIWIKGGN